VDGVAAGAGWRTRERIFRLSQFLQLLVDCIQGWSIETGADTSRIAQLAVLDHAQQQRAEKLAAALRFGITGNHEFLSLPAFQLDPCAAALADVERIGAFADEAFHRQRTGAIKQLVWRFRERCAEAQHVVVYITGMFQ
jgi:hypothetical protein